jgi:nucleoside-triphosphatase
MPRNFFITGNPKSGKTTLLKQLVKELKKTGLKVGGFVSPDERHHGTRTAFRVMDVDSGKTAMLARVDGDGPKVSKYHVDVKSFEGIALPSMKKSRDYDVVIIDEIGAMELKSAKFASMLDDLLESETHLIATLHRDLVDKYATDGEVLEIDEENRSQVYQRLFREAASMKKAPKKKAEKPQKKAPEKKMAPAKKAGKKPPKVGMEEVAEQEVKPEKEKPKEQGGLLHRIKKLFGS